MAKDRPGNRSGRDGGGNFRGRGPDRSSGKPAHGKPWQKKAGPRPPRRDDPAPSGEFVDGDKDKPWEKRGRHQQVERDRPQRRFDRPSPKDRPREDRQRDDRPSFKNDRPHHKPSPPPSGQWERREAVFEEHGEVWIWGIHAAAAAIRNPKRKITRALVSRNAAHRAGLDPEALPKYAELLDPREIDQRLAPGAVHQGIAVRSKPLEGLDIADAAMQPEHPLAILDQVTDPQNAGAIFRSAAAFGIAGVVLQTRNAPLLGGALAKAATGAIETVEEIRVVNLSRAIDTLRDAGWKVIGLDGSAEQTIDQAFAGPEPLAIVLGAEGAGIRPGVAKACTGLARIPIGVAMESLNVSNAAAIAFYEAARARGAAIPPPKSPTRQAASDASDEDADADETD